MDIPLYANAYDITNVQDFRTLEETAGLVGLDSYPPNEFTGRFSPKGEDFKHRRLNEVWRSLRTFSKCSYLAEYQAGNPHGLHHWVGVLTPNHFVMAGLSAIQAGVQAWNWFMLVNHDNFMMCPINEWGRKQGELFRAFAEVVRLYKEAAVPQLNRVTNISALFDTKYQMFAESLDDPIQSSLYQANIDYEFYNPETEQIKKPIMFYSAGRWLDRKIQQKLLDYVQQGGTLIFFRTLPLFDEDNQTPCNELNLIAPDCGMDVPFLDHLASELKVSFSGTDVLTKAPFLYYQSPTPGTPIFASCVDSTRVWDTAFEENRQIRSLIFQKRYTVGYIEPRGKGKILVVSLKPTPELLRGVFKMLAIEEPVNVQMPQVKHALFLGPNAHELVLINTGDQAVFSQIQLSKKQFPPGFFQLRNLRDGEDYQMTVSDKDKSNFYIQLPHKDGTIIEIVSGSDSSTRRAK